MTASPEKPQPAAGWRRRLLNRYALLILALPSLAAAGYFAWQKFYGQGNELEQYQIVAVQRGDLEDLVTAIGTIQPQEYVDVGAQVSGQLKKIHVEVGSVVKAGDLLAEIDPTVFRANVDARRALLRNQTATLRDRESQLALTQIQHVRQKNLMAGDATTAESLQSAEAAVRSAKAQTDALKAQIEQTESTLRADEANLNYARIYAPISGVVVSITARQGQTLNANQQAPTVLRIADLSTMTVQTQVSEADVGRLQPDMEVYFTTLGSRGKRWYSALKKVEPTPVITNNVVLYNALFDVANAQRSLLPQMTAQVFFVAATARDTLVVPASAVNLRRGGEKRERAEEGKKREEAARPAEPSPKAEAGAAASALASAVEVVKVAAAEETRPALRRERAGQEAGDGEPRRSFRDMSPEERRAAIERMTPEEREAFRERRRAAAGRGSEAGAETSAASAAPAEAARPERAGGDGGKPSRRQEAAAAGSAETSARLPVWAGVSAQRQRAPREGLVKVVNADGKIEERTVQIGISNRVQVQILSGLAEGEQVVAGQKPPPGAPRAQNQRNALQNQGGVPGAPGMGGGQGGSGRTR